MSDEVTLSVEEAKDEETGHPAFCFIWEFPESIAPEFGSVIKGEATWKTKYGAVAKEKTQQLEGAISTWAAPLPPDSDSSDTQLVAGANLYLNRIFFKGTVEIEIKWTVHDSTEEKTHTHTAIAGNQLNALDDKTVATEVPNLTLALDADLTSEEQLIIQTSDPVPTDDSEAHQYYGQLVERALKVMDQKLSMGLGRYWRRMGSQCTNDTGDKALSELRGDELNGLTMQQLDECWAQLATELFIGSCYNGPGAHHNISAWPSGPGGSDHRRDTRFFRYVRSRAQGEEIPDDDNATPVPRGDSEYIVSLCYACQQLSVATLMSRSADYHTLAEDPMDSGAPEPHGRITDKSTHMGNSGAITGVELWDKGWLVPGACYFRPSSPRTGVHVATLLRAFQSTKIQLLDTGAWWFHRNIVPKQTYPLNWDTPARDQFPRSVHGVLIPPAVDKAKLTEAIRLMHKARPLGFARVVIYRRGSTPNQNSALWVSRRLFMHNGSGDNYRYHSVAALMDSLRACPHADRLDVRWQIYRPLNTKAVRNAFNKGHSTRWWEDSDEPTSRHSPTIELSVELDGKPSVKQRNSQFDSPDATFSPRLNSLESVTTADEIEAARASANSLADVNNDNLPAYFKK